MTRGRPRKIEQIEQIEQNEAENTQQSAAQDYANRVWAGQSVSLPLRERIERIKSALSGQGFTDFSNLKFPVEDAEKYL